MNILEFEIEELARTVVCPICGAKPDRPCRGESVRFKTIGSWNFSHLGRLKVARGERP